MSNQSLRLIQKRLFQILVFLTPTQLAYHFWPKWAHVFGIRVDYLAPKIFLTDLLIVLLFIFWILSKKNIAKNISHFLTRRKTAFTTIFIALFVFLNISLAQVPAVSLVKWLKILEVLFVFHFIRTEAKDIKEYLYGPIYYSIYLFSAIGILQFIFKGTLGNLFYYLGERTFDLHTPGIALFTFLGNNFLRAYSTFSHPNSFAGYLLVAFSFLFFSGYISRKRFCEKLSFYTIFFSAFAFTFSRSAFIALLLIFFLDYLYRKTRFLNKYAFSLILAVSLIISLLMPLVSEHLLTRDKLAESLEDRAIMAVVAGRMVSDKFILGEGFNNFIVKLPEYTTMSRSIWTLQPVHNIFLLVFSETGIIGLLIFVYMFFGSFNKFPKKGSSLEKVINYSLLAILLTGLTDHYWLTLQQNILIFAFVLGLAFKKRQ